MPKILLKSQRASFKERAKNRVLAESNRIIDKYSLDQLILVLDEVTARIVSTLFTLPQLVEHHITFVQSLHVARKSLPFHALYFIGPKEENISRLLSDFKDEDDPMYKKVHILFCNRLERNLLKSIASSKTLLKRLSRHSLREMYFEFTLLSQDTLTLELPYLSQAFSNRPNQKKTTSLARKFVELIANFCTFNSVRFVFEKTKSKVTEELAESAILELKGYFGNLLQSKSESIDHKAPEITILLLDRSIDIITPLIHSCSYEPMLFDMNRIELDSANPKAPIECYSKIQSDIYDKIRYQHITQALSVLPERLQEVTQQLKNLTRPQDISQQTMEHKSIQKHITLSQDLMQEFTSKNLIQICELEQSLATGVDSKQKETSSSELLRQVINIVKTNTVISQEEKIRLAVLAICCIKLCKKDYMDLMDLFNEREKQILKSLIALGVSYDSSLSRSTKAMDKTHQIRACKRIEMTKMPMDRYTTALELIIPNFLGNPNREDKSLNSLRVSAVDEQVLETFDGNRFVVFMCGGLSWGQIASVKKNLKQVVLACDQVLNPSGFLQELSKIRID